MGTANTTTNPNLNLNRNPHVRRVHHGVLVFWMIPALRVDLPPPFLKASPLLGQPSFWITLAQAGQILQVRERHFSLMKNPGPILFLLRPVPTLFHLWAGPWIGIGYNHNLNPNFNLRTSVSPRINKKVSREKEVKLLAVQILPLTHHRPPCLNLRCRPC